MYIFFQKYSPDPPNSPAMATLFLDAYIHNVLTIKT